MSAYEITLSATGMFEIPALAAGGETLRVGCNSEDQVLPWFVLGTDEIGVKWRRVRSFGDLDSALDFAVSQISGADIHEYDVRLPCGQVFRRPGRVPAEQVMASMNWLYVEEMCGYSAFTTNISAGNSEARKEIFEKVRDTQIELGSVDLVEEAEGRRHWCADVSIPFQGFIHRDDIEAQFKISFAAEGFPVIDEMMDFRARILKPAAEAVILDFKAFRDARIRKAA